MEDVERRTDNGGRRTENGGWRMDNGGWRTEVGIYHGVTDNTEFFFIFLVYFVSSWSIYAFRYSRVGNQYPHPASISIISSCISFFSALFLPSV